MNNNMETMYVITQILVNDSKKTRKYNKDAIIMNTRKNDFDPWLYHAEVVEGIAFSGESGFDLKDTEGEDGIKKMLGALLNSEAEEHYRVRYDLEETSLHSLFLSMPQYAAATVDFQKIENGKATAKSFIFVKEASGHPDYPDVRAVVATHPVVDGYAQEKIKELKNLARQKKR